MLSADITSKLKNTPEQQTVVGPLVANLVKNGWKLEQIIFGKSEWRVPKSPSEATKREKKQSFSGFPVDVAVFDDPTTVGDPRHLLFIIECKQETETAGVSQLESYFVGEPYVQLGAWINNATPSAPAVFLYRKAVVVRRCIAAFKRGRGAESSSASGACSCGSTTSCAASAGAGRR